MSRANAVRSPPSKRPNIRLLSLLILAAAMTACGSEQAGDGGVGGELASDPTLPTLAPLPLRFDGTWQGLLPCVDCDGIGVVLQLTRDENAALYEMRESYFGAADAEDYVTEGPWTEVLCTLAGEPGQCVVLEEPALRWYRRGDGSLQGVDAEGRALDGADALLQRR